LCLSFNPPFLCFLSRLIPCCLSFSLFPLPFPSCLYFLRYSAHSRWAVESHL
jgi:hypothetical protein